MSLGQCSHDTIDALQALTVCLGLFNAVKSKLDSQQIVFDKSVHHDRELGLLGRFSRLWALSCAISSSRFNPLNASAGFFDLDAVTPPFSEIWLEEGLAWLDDTTFCFNSDSCCWVSLILEKLPCLDVCADPEPDLFWNVKSAASSEIGVLLGESSQSVFPAGHSKFLDGSTVETGCPFELYSGRTGSDLQLEHIWQNSQQKIHTMASILYFSLNVFECMWQRHFKAHRVPLHCEDISCNETCICTISHETWNCGSTIP